MPRIVVIGSSCSGKSTLAKRLSQHFGVDYVQLDAIHWLPNWVERDPATFLELLTKAIDRKSWVVDGNYRKIRHVLWERAQIIVWLNYSFRVVLWRALKRTLRRAYTKEELYSGNRESFRQSFFSKDSILLYILLNFHQKREQYRQEFKDNHFPHVHLIELRRPSEAKSVVERIEQIQTGKPSK